MSVESAVTWVIVLYVLAERFVRLVLPKLVS